MVKNEKQYRITKAQIRRFQEALGKLVDEDRPAKITPRLWDAQRRALQSQLEDLRKETEAYERR